jgi:hypothetical protein
VACGAYGTEPLHRLVRHRFDLCRFGPCRMIWLLRRSTLYDNIDMPKILESSNRSRQSKAFAPSLSDFSTILRVPQLQRDDSIAQPSGQHHSTFEALNDEHAGGKLETEETNEVDSDIFPAFTSGFNGHYLLDVMKRIDGETCRF